MTSLHRPTPILSPPRDNQSDDVLDEAMDFVTPLVDEVDSPDQSSVTTSDCWNDSLAPTASKPKLFVAEEVLASPPTNSAVNSPNTSRTLYGSGVVSGAMAAASTSHRASSRDKAPVVGLADSLTVLDTSTSLGLHLTISRVPLPPPPLPSTSSRGTSTGCCTPVGASTPQLRQPQLTLPVHSPLLTPTGGVGRTPTTRKGRSPQLNSFGLSNSRLRPHIARDLATMWHVAFAQPHRPLLETLRTPRWPSRDTCLLRIFVNLFYFTRNYINFVVVMFLVHCLLAPPYAVAFALACALNVVRNCCGPTAAGGVVVDRVGATTTPSVVTATSIATRPPRLLQVLALAQAVVCAGVVYWVGLPVVLLFLASIVVPVVLHAALTPYTRAAVDNYIVLTGRRRRGSVVAPPPPPRSPTLVLDAVHPTFADALPHGFKMVTKDDSDVEDD